MAGVHESVFRMVRNTQAIVNDEVVAFHQIQTNLISDDLDLGVIECDRQFRQVHAAAGVPADGKQVAFLYFFLPSLDARTSLNENQPNTHR